MSKKIVKSTDIYLKGLNTGKQELLDLFLNEYRMAVSFYIKYYFEKVFYKSSSHINLFALKKHKFYPFNPEIKSKLSGRALKCAKTQAMGMINSATTKQRKRVWKLADLQRKGGNHLNLQRVVSKTKIKKPSIPKNFKAELNSIIVCLKDSNTSFDLAFEFSSLFSKEYKKKISFENKFTVLVNKNRHYHSLDQKGTQMTSFLVQNDRISVRFEIDTPKQKKVGTKMGIDQGISTCISITETDGNIWVSTKCPHGWDLTSIQKKLARHKKGTKAFLKAQRHRTNYINWTINQLDLSNTKEVRLERLRDVRKGKRTNRFLSHFTYTQIESKIKDKCEQEGVLFVLSTNQYRSQRCSCCGFVHSKNRKGKSFTCTSCGFTEDADVNASMNHLVDLPDLDRFLIGSCNRTSGFFWNPLFDGVYSPVK